MKNIELLYFTVAKNCVSTARHTFFCRADDIFCRAYDIFEKSVEQSRFEQMHFEQLTLTRWKTLDKTDVMIWGAENAMKLTFHGTFQQVFKPEIHRIGWLCRLTWMRATRGCSMLVVQSLAQVRTTLRCSWKQNQNRMLLMTCRFFWTILIYVNFSVVKSIIYHYKQDKG